MHKKYVYIVLMRTQTFISKSIKLVTSDEYTHSSISLDKNLTNMYSFGRPFAYTPFFARFVEEEFHKGLLGTHNYLPGIVIELEVTEYQYEIIQDLLNHFILNYSTYKYNYLGILYNYINKEVTSRNRFLCSEFVYYVLNESKVLDFSKSRNLVRPIDFLALEENIIFKGDLKDFQLQENVRFSKRVYVRNLISLFQ